VEFSGEREDRLIHNVNVRIKPDDLLDFQEASAWAGLSLNKWLVRAARQKYEQEVALRHLRDVEQSSTMERLLREQERKDASEVYGAT